MTKILLFTMRARFPDELSLRLKSRQIKVLRTKSISRLHDYLVSHPIDAVIVDAEFFAARCIVPSKHLWEARSPITIIRYAAETAAAITTDLFRIPDEISGIESKPGRDERERSIMQALSLPVQGEIRECEPTYATDGQPVRIELPDERKKAIHRKMRAVLELLERAGPEGIAPKEIAENIWGKETKDRTKDIQIYICKLRRIAAENGYEIRLEDGRYALKDYGPKKQTPD